MTERAPYREGGMVERRAFACPSCNTPALAETEESAICSRCDIRFSTREPALAQGLVPLPAQRGLMPLNRWRLAPYIAGVVAATVFGGWLCGVIGAASGFFAGAFVSLNAFVHDLLRESR